MTVNKEALVHILYSGLGGHASVVFSLVEADSERKFRHFIVFYGIEQVPVAYIEKCRQLGAQHFFVHKQPGFDSLSYKAVTRIISDIRPTAILLHSVNLILPAWKVAKRTGSKLIAIEHQPNHLKSKREFLWSFLLMFMAGRVVYLTDLYRQQMKKILGLAFRPEKVTVINNGINTSLYNSDGRPVTDIGMLARITPTKDHKTLLRAWKNIERELDCKLLIAGDGESRGEVEELSLELDLRNVSFEGMLDEASSADFLKGLKIYVHASLGETMSTSLMQAMACGKPIIASDVEGINNMIESGVNGILVPAKDPAALAAAISGLSGNEELRQSLGRNARATAVERFSNLSMFKKYLSLISP